jgi:hypothetical protein
VLLGWVSSGVLITKMASNLHMYRDITSNYASLKNCNNSKQKSNRCWAFLYYNNVNLILTCHLLIKNIKGFFKLSQQRLRIFSI